MPLHTNRIRLAKWCVESTWTCAKTRLHTIRFCLSKRHVEITRNCMKTHLHTVIIDHKSSRVRGLLWWRAFNSASSTKPAGYQNYADPCLYASVQHPHSLNYTLRKEDGDGVQTQFQYQQPHYWAVRDATSHGATRVSLPKIQLKRFGGDILDFANFWENFSQCIGNRPDISDVNKFSYLVGQLDGEAAKAIRGIAQRNENYHQAVTALHLRFSPTQRELPSSCNSSTSSLQRPEENDS